MRRASYRGCAAGVQFSCNTMRAVDVAAATRRGAARSVRESLRPNVSELYNIRCATAATDYLVDCRMSKREAAGPAIADAVNKRGQEASPGPAITHAARRLPSAGANFTFRRFQRLQTGQPT
jgi:hypothetical protein